MGKEWKNNNKVAGSKACIIEKNHIMKWWQVDKKGTT